MQITKKQSKLSTLTRISAAFGLSLLLLTTTYPGVHKAAAVGSSCSTIADCTNQINATTQQVSNLKNEAVSYKDAITRLQSTISTKQNEISSSRNQQSNLEKQIADAQQQITEQKNVLGELLRNMYQDGQMTAIESLAASENLSVYVNKEEYRTHVESSVKDNLDAIAAMQARLQNQKAQVASLLSQQQSQAASLSNDRAQQSDMLNYNQSQQASFNALTSANQAKLLALIAAQRAANNNIKSGYYFIHFGGTPNISPGGYPYANAGFSMSTAPGCNDGDGPDQWGYCTRQCVSFTAWAVQASGKAAPRGWGDAKRWVAHARAAGYSVDGVPRAGDVAISTSGTWGHAMFVHSVQGNYIDVYQYNQQLTGRFSQQLRKFK